jgi:hypothetical protein
VAQRHDIYSDDHEPRANEEYVTADTLDEIRKHIPPGLYCLPRYADDDANIVFVWL